MSCSSVVRGYGYVVHQKNKFGSGLAAPESPSPVGNWLLLRFARRLRCARHRNLRQFFGRLAIAVLAIMPAVAPQAGRLGQRAGAQQTKRAVLSQLLRVDKWVLGLDAREDFIHV